MPDNQPNHAAPLTRDDINQLLQIWADFMPAGRLPRTIVPMGTAAMVLHGLIDHAGDVDYLPTAQALPLPYKLRIRRRQLADFPVVHDPELAEREATFDDIRLNATAASIHFLTQRGASPHARNSFFINDAMDTGTAGRPFTPDLISYHNEQPREFTGENGGKLIVVLPSLESLLASRLVTGPRSQKNDMKNIIVLLRALGLDKAEPATLMETIGLIAKRSFRPKTRLAAPIHIYTHVCTGGTERAIACTFNADEMLAHAADLRRCSTPANALSAIAQKLGFR